MDTVVTSDTQAALRAAATIHSAFVAAALTDATAERVAHRTLSMAETFLEWLRRNDVPQLITPAPQDNEKLTPGVDFAFKQFQDTVRDEIARREQETRELQIRPRQQHVLSAVTRTPSGKFACTCGQPWPCSQR